MQDIGDDQPRFRDVLEELGKPGSRALLATPALVCDRDLLVENVALMARKVALGNTALRPHVKAHKSAYIARLQLEAGATGLAFAKLSEAETVIARLLRDGYPRRVSALLTSPLVGDGLSRRAVTLAKHCDAIFVVDHLDGVDELEYAAAGANLELSVLCDVDVGLGRTGVVGPDEALHVVERIETSPHLNFGGVQGYGGQLQHIAGRDNRQVATTTSTRSLEVVIDALESHGHAVSLRTGGGTGTSEIDLGLGVLNELQCGSYIFMDRQYRDALGNDPEGHFGQSLSIETTVISENQRGFITVDAGMKAMATDAGNPTIVGDDGVRYSFFGDEHGLVTRNESKPLRRGDRLELMPPHCDTTVDKYDVIWLVQGNVVLDLVEVVARGRSQ